MLIRIFRHVVKRSTFSPVLVRFQSTKVSKPLRILFCGSDDFSSASLKALHAEQQKDPEGIASIDVLCRPNKPSGRGLKTTKEVPIKAVAVELGLPVHQRDTFTGWELPKPSEENINLVIAVSFGLFVPPRILRSAEYGGLNVHPSLLPNFRGPAPLQGVILTNTQSTGVTLQTLDEKNFDHGIILAQTGQKDLLHISKTCTYHELLERITPVAADMLVQGIRDKVYVPPYEDRGWYQITHLRPAPKLTVADREINWKLWPGAHIDRCARAIGRLWNKVGVDPYSTKRFIFEDVEKVPVPDAIKSWFDFIEQNDRGGRYNGEIERQRLKHEIRFLNIKLEQEGDWAQPYIHDGNAIIFPTRHQEAIRVKEITVGGAGKLPATHVMLSIKEDEHWELRRGRNFSFRIQMKGPRIRRLQQNADFVGPDRTEDSGKKAVKELSEKQDL